MGIEALDDRMRLTEQVCSEDRADDLESVASQGKCANRFLRNKETAEQKMTRNQRSALKIHCGTCTAATSSTCSACCRASTRSTSTRSSCEPAPRKAAYAQQRDAKESCGKICKRTARTKSNGKNASDKSKTYANKSDIACKANCKDNVPSEMDILLYLTDCVGSQIRTAVSEGKTT